MYRSPLFRALVFLSLLGVTGCGYRIENICSNSTLTIPFIRGDSDGRLTNAVTRQIDTSGLYRITNCDGHETLCIQLINCCEQNIGFRYDDNKEGEMTRTLVPIEVRYTLTIELSLIHCGTGKTTLGPIQLSASVDFDHDYYSSADSVNTFSLGQLTNVESARYTAYDVVSRKLAAKIVDYLYAIR